MIIEEELVGEFSLEDAEKLFGKDLYVEFNYCSDGIEGQLEDLYENEVMRIIIKMENGEYEDRELHEVSYYEVR